MDTEPRITDPRALEQHDFELAVVAALRERHNLDVSYEYPGFICLPMSDGSNWNIGTTNECWDGNLTTPSGQELALIHTDILSTTRDLDELVSRIAECITASTPEDVKPKTI